MIDEKRSPKRHGPVCSEETYEIRLSRLENQIYSLEQGFVRLRDELTRCITMFSDLSTDVAVIQLQIKGAEFPKRYHANDLHK